MVILLTYSTSPSHSRQWLSFSLVNSIFDLLLVQIKPNHKRFIKEKTMDNKIQVRTLYYQMRAHKIKDFTLANLTRRFYSLTRKLAVGNGLRDCRIQPTLPKSPPSVMRSNDDVRKRGFHTSASLNQQNQHRRRTPRDHLKITYRNPIAPRLFKTLVNSLRI